MQLWCLQIESRCISVSALYHSCGINNFRIKHQARLFHAAWSASCWWLWRVMMIKLQQLSSSSSQLPSAFIPRLNKFRCMLRRDQRESSCQTHTENQTPGDRSVEGSDLLCNELGRMERWICLVRLYLQLLPLSFKFLKRRCMHFMFLYVWMHFSDCYTNSNCNSAFSPKTEWQSRLSS